MAPDTASHKAFPLKLGTHYMEYFRIYAFVYRQLLERLGRCAVEEAWHAADAAFEDDLFLELLGSTWEPESVPTDLPAQRRELIERLFELPVQGVSPGIALDFLLSIGPFRQLEARFPDHSAQRDCTTYEALHLLAHGLACLAETAVDRFGDSASFMIYDALLQEADERVVSQGSGREWVKAIFDRVQAANDPEPEGTPSEEAPVRLSMGAAGHAEEIVRVAEDEVVVHMTQCSWADYYLDRHPTVGVLLGCCIDDPVYRRTANGLRLQRQHTLMENGPYCDFRFYPA